MARIKKIMQSDEEVGKVSKFAPVLISKSLELFLQDLLTQSAAVTQAKHGKTVTAAHIKQCVMSTAAFDFLTDIVKDIPDIVEGDDPKKTRKPRTRNNSKPSQTKAEQKGKSEEEEEQAGEEDEEDEAEE